MLIPEKGRVSWFLIWGEGGSVQGLGWRGGLHGLPSSKEVLSVGGMTQDSAFAPGSSKLAVGFFGLCIFCPEFVPTAVSFSGMQFFGVLLLMDWCVQVQALQLCSSSGF